VSARDDRTHRLGGIYVESGVSHRTREPFCRVSVQGETSPGVLPGVPGSMRLELVGQLTPLEVRTLALQWLAAAEAAIHDAAVFALATTKLGMDERMAGQLISQVREHRADAYLMEDPDGPDA
jgi:hypothetical protein